MTTFHPYWCKHGMRGRHRWSIIKRWKEDDDFYVMQRCRYCDSWKRRKLYDVLNSANRRIVSETDYVKEHPVVAVTMLRDEERESQGALATEAAREEEQAKAEAEAEEAAAAEAMAEAEAAGS